MATNKIINDLERIKLATDTLRVNLVNGGVDNVLPTNTLPELVNRVPEMSTSTPAPDDEYAQDPLWKFPYPNENSPLKTINEIYDELDTSEYPYRAVYLVYGLEDTIVLDKRLNRYILSDGSVYDTAGADITHTWDKSKDRFDSVGRNIRYVIGMNTTPQKYPDNYNDNVIGAVLGLSDTLSTNGSQYNKDGYANCVNIKFIYLDDMYEKLDTYSLTATTSLEYLKSDNIKYVGGSAFSTGSKSSSLKNIKIHEDATRVDVGGMSNPVLKSINVPITVFNGSNTLTNAYNLKYLHLKDDGMPSNTFTNLISLTTLIFENVQSIPQGTFTSMYNLKELTLPRTVARLLTPFSGNRFETLIIENPDITFNNINIPAYYLINLIVPIDFNFNGVLNMSQWRSISKQSLVNLLNNLKDLTGQSAKIINLGQVNLDKLTPEEIVIATNKNWTLT